MEIPGYFSVAFLVILAGVLAWVARHISDSYTDSTVETELDNAEIDNQRAGTETSRISETVRECKDTAETIRKRESDTGKSIELAESAVKTAYGNNRKAAEIIDECITIIEEAENKRDCDN